MLANLSFGGLLLVIHYPPEGHKRLFVLNKLLVPQKLFVVNDELDAFMGSL